MNHLQRETALDTRRTHREERTLLNPYHRILYTGSASDRYQVLKFTRIKGQLKAAPIGCHDTLEDAMQARDSEPAAMPVRPWTSDITLPKWNR